MALNTPVCDFGWQAPDFELEDTHGSRQTLASLRGPTASPETAAPLTKPRPRVALLGLHVEPKSPEKLSHFAVTFSELLFTELSAGQQLFLFPTDVIEKAKLQLKLDVNNTFISDTLPKLHALLGPDLVVSGGARMEGSDPPRVYITLVVKNAQNGLPVAATQTDGAAEKLFEMVAFVGASTAIFAATIGLTQFDIKRVIAYSTCSQLGYMFFACGVGAYGAGVFHLYTHAFFKALLFLGAGSVIHAMSDEQDMRRMGGIWKHIKITYAVMWIGTLALIGFPGFAGYFSKDAILEAAYASENPFHLYAFWMGVLAAVLTAFYSGRLMWLTFHGEPRADHETMHHVHESPPVMTIPLMVLAVGAVLAGWLGTGLVDPEGEAWAGAIYYGEHNHVLHAMHEVPLWVKLAPFFAMALGLGFSYVCYILRPGLSVQIAQAAGPINRFFFNKWYFDELYDLLFVRTAKALGLGLWRGGDQGIIDRFGPDGVAWSAMRTSKRAVRLQTGYVYHYAFVMLIGVAALVSWYLYLTLG